MLCDSDSDVEVVPLFERIGGLGAKGKGKAKPCELGKTPCGSVSEKTQTQANRAFSSCSGSREDVICGSGNRVKEAQGTSLDSGPVSPKDLTPAQRAGMAALRRLESSKSTRDMEASIPILDLTDEETELTPPPAKRSASISSWQQGNSRPTVANPTPQSSILDLTGEHPDSPPTLSGGASNCKYTAAPSRSVPTLDRERSSGEDSVPSGRMTSSSTHSNHSLKTPNQLPAPSTAVGAAVKEKEGGQGPPVSDSFDLGKPEFVLRPGRSIASGDSSPFLSLASQPHYSVDELREFPF